MAYGFTYTLPTITGSHSDFPVLLKANDFASAAIDGGVSSIDNGGGNLRAYTSSAKTTQLPVHVVAFVAGGTPVADVRIKIPTAATSNTIYIEADAVETTQPAVTNAYGRNAVYSDYYAVLCLNDGSYGDVTGNGHDGTVTGTLTQTTTSHPWGGEWTSFDNNVNEYITIDGSSDFGDSAADVTMSVWTKANANSVGGILSNRLSSEAANYFQINKRSAANEWQMSADDGGGEVLTKPIASTSSAHLLHFAIDSGSAIPSVDGVSTGTLAFSGDGLLQSSNPITIGHYYQLGVTAYDYYGYIGEVRLRESYLSIDWRATEYANQSASSAWGTVGTWADSGSGTNVSASVDTKTLTTYTASVANNVNVASNTATKTLTTYSATVSTTANVEVGTQTATKTLTTYQANIANDISIASGISSKTITTYAANIALGKNVDASVVNKTLTTYTSDITVNVNVPSNTDTKTFTTYAATISVVDNNVDVNANTATLNLVTYSATIDKYIQQSVNRQFIGKSSYRAFAGNISNRSFTGSGSNRSFLGNI